MKLFKKKVQKGILKDVDVKLVSMLFDEVKPANGKSFVAKSEDGKTHKGILETTKFKADDAGRVYVTLMEPDVEDKQGDTITKDEIVKACDNFAKGGLLKKNDVNHNMEAVEDVLIAETYILKTEDKEHFPDTAIGSWVQVLKFDIKSELWKQVKDGKFNGVSIYGSAAEKAESDNDVLIEIDAIKAGIQKIQDAIEGKDDTEIEKQVEALTKKMEKMKKEHKNNVEVRKFADKVEELNKTLKKGISKTLKGEPGEVMKDKETIVGGVKLLVKADKEELYKGIANTDSGDKMNILNENTTQLFMDGVMSTDPSDTLADISVVPLLKDEKVDYGLIGDIVLKNSDDGTPDELAVDENELTCQTGILAADVSLKQDTVEFYKEKYGDTAFGAYVEQKIANKTNEAVRQLLFKGDRTSATATLKGLNGVVKQATDNSAVVDIDNVTYESWTSKFTKLLTDFDDTVLEKVENFKIYIAHKDLIRLRAELGERQTNKGDQLLLEGGKVFFAGYEVKGRMLAENYIVAGLSKYIILGYRADAEMKVEHHGDDWKYHWYLRLRAGFTYLSNFVKVYHIVIV